MICSNGNVAARENYDIPTPELTAPCSASELTGHINFSGYHGAPRTVDTLLISNMVVREAGLEPARPYEQRIFLLLHVAMAALLRCSLDYVFSILKVRLAPFADPTLRYLGRSLA